MPEFVIGRQGTQPFPISDAYYHVSTRHALITIDEQGQWWIEDLNSTNGTYIQDPTTGEFVRVQKKRIHEYQRISLGGTKVGCYSFLAHHVLEPYSPLPAEDAHHYSKEFHHVLQTHDALTQERQALEQKIKNNQIIKFLPPLLIALIGLPLYFLGKNDERITITYLIAQLASIIPFIDIFSKKKKQLNTLKKRMSKLVLCPHCGTPLSEFEIQRQSCSKCMAHS